MARTPQEPPGQEDPWHPAGKLRQCETLPFPLRAQGSQPQPQTFSFPFQREPPGAIRVQPSSHQRDCNLPQGYPREADTLPQERPIRAGDRWVGGVLSALPNKQKARSQGLRFPPGMERRGGQACGPHWGVRVKANL